MAGINDRVSRAIQSRANDALESADPIEARAARQIAAGGDALAFAIDDFRKKYRTINAGTDLPGPGDHTIMRNVDRWWPRIVERWPEGEDLHPQDPEHRKGSDWKTT